MINSMTGYASGSAQVGSLSLDLEIKSVNSKSLDLKIYLPEYLSSLENELRQVTSSHAKSVNTPPHACCRACATVATGSKTYLLESDFET